MEDESESGVQRANVEMGRRGTQREGNKGGRERRKQTYLTATTLRPNHLGAPFSSKRNKDRGLCRVVRKKSEAERMAA
jgi:hypothetical protein